MHFINQYYRIYAAQPGPLFRVCARQLQASHAPECPVARTHQSAVLLEQLMLLVAVLGLVLKVTSKEYILERLQPFADQLELFNDNSSEFKAVRALFQTQHCECKQTSCARSCSTLEQTSYHSPPVQAEKPLSDPDLAFCKCVYEDRLKSALQYNLVYESPLQYLHQFFADAFEADQLAPVLGWQQLTEQMLLDFAWIPFALFFHPALIAAAFLNWTREHVSKAYLPELVHEHAWYLYVDAAIGPGELSELTQVLSQEFTFINRLLQDH